MDSSKLVWLPDSKHGYAIGRIMDIRQEKVFVQPVAMGSQVSIKHELISNEDHQQQQQQTNLEFPYKSIYPCDHLDLATILSGGGGNKPEAMTVSDVDDNCALIHLNEAALLENVRIRFHRDKIYTYVAHILIAVNPYFEIKGLHSPEAILKYQGKSLGTMPPHVYAIADKAYRDMKAFKRSQSIIINGESGAGKTESQKYVLRYLCLSGSQSGRLEKLILDANPLLEAFGNAKTIRNNNSSRFGKFIEIHYSSKFQVSGGLFFHYLLEKSRICTQSPGERNYHIFYQLCACLPQEQWKQLELGSPDEFHYLNGGCTQYFCNQQDDSRLAPERKSQFQRQNGAIQDQLIDDLKCYQQTDRALTNFGVSEEEKARIYSIVGAVLHLGNVAFCDDPDDNRGGCRIEASQRAEGALESTARLMGLDRDLLRQSLVSRIMSTSRGGHKGTVYMVQLSAQQAQAARDALAKAIYSKLFDYIVTKIVNKSIPTIATSAYYIGVLDVAGFEYFKHNSFEQFLINFCNEKLQQFFNERILKEEQAIYDKEGLNLERVDFIDNQDCLQLLEAKSAGIFDLLDEESRLPRPSAQHFTQSVHTSNKNHFRLALPRTSKLKSHRVIRDDEGFLIRHFAGAVCYETHSFIDKNNDALHASLKNLMLDASHSMLRDLFADNQVSSTGSGGGGGGAGSQQGSHHAQLVQNVFGGSTASLSTSSSSSPASPSSPAGNKLNFISVGTTFRSQLNDLMGKLRSTGSHFIRCIKPNGEMVAHKFEGGQILSQLHCSGMDSVLKLMQQGYPSRSSFNDLYQSYVRYLPKELARLDSHLFCRALFKALGLSDRDFRFGSSKVFFRPGKFAEFDQIIRSDSEHVAQLVKRVSRWLICSRWRKAQYCCLSAIKLQNKILYRKNLIIRLQKNWRFALVQRRLRFGLNALKAARGIELSLRDFGQISLGDQLKKSPDRKVIDEQAQLLKQEVDNYISELTRDVQSIIAAAADSENKRSSITRAERQQELDKLLTKRDLLVRSIKDKLAKQKELMELERRVAADNKRREEEELALRRDEAIKRQRNELELRRQEELRGNQTAQAAAAAGGAIKSQVAAATGSELQQQQPRRKQLVDSGTDPMETTHQEDQERRDYEIALRLAQDSSGGSAVWADEGQPASQMGRRPLAPSQNHSNAGGQQQQQQQQNRFDLTKWKYSDLRDTINTSCDLELLEACKREFHRRLKVYHAWRAMNSRQAPGASGGGLGGPHHQLRAPSSVMEGAAGSGGSEKSLSPDRSQRAGAGRPLYNEQRYFRIPFVKGQGPSLGGQRGWWFAHFDGQWIARQLELHPDKEPILLIAGQHDIEMCELSLHETRLSSKRGAEILPQEFEEEWLKHGGRPYIRRDHQQQQTSGGSPAAGGGGASSNQNSSTGGHTKTHHHLAASS